jgi:hypothetical protein
LGSILDELVQVGARHHGSGGDGDVLSHPVGRRVDHRRDSWWPGHVAEEVGGAAHVVHPAGVDRLLQRLRVGERGVARRQRLDEVVNDELHLLRRLPAQVGVADEGLGGRAGG